MIVFLKEGGKPMIIEDDFNGNISELEFRGIEEAVKFYGIKGNVFYSDNISAVKKARFKWKHLKIRHISGDKNPADKFTRKVR